MIIWIASYPKSGNTWVRSFLSSYYFSRDGNFNFKLLKNIKQFPSKEFFKEKLTSVEEASHNWLEAQKKIKKSKKVYFLKTHNIYGAYKGNYFTTPEYSLGLISIVRDPRNVITSLMHHYSINEEEGLKMISSKFRNLKDKNNLEDYASYSFISSWANNYNSWKRSDIKNKILIKYEDLENNNEVTFRKIIRFINKILNKSEDIDEIKFNNSIRTTNFDLLKKKEEKDGFDEAIFDEKGQRKTFFNLGNRNNYKTLLNNNSILQIEKEFNNEMKELGYLET